MSDGKFNNDYDEYDDYDDSDNFKYEEYNDDYSLTRDDEMPLTRSEPEQEKPLESAGVYDTKRVRQSSRRETIRQVAEEQKSGNPRKPGVMGVDPRLAPRPRNNQYAGRRLSGDIPARRPSPKRIAAPRMSQKSMFEMFKIGSLTICTLLCFFALFYFYTLIRDRIEGGGNGSIFPPRPTQSPLPEPSPTIMPVRGEIHSQTALITGINPFGETRSITVLDINTRRTQEFTMTEDTRLYDRLNRSLSFAELRVGNMVDIRYDSRNFNLDTVLESRQSFERRSRTNVHINIQDSLITLGNDTWSYIPGQTLVLHRGERFPIGQISAIDSVTLVGHGDTIWLVQVDAAHGFLQFNNTDVIANGSVMVGNNLVFKLEDIVSDIELPEGTHRVIVEGDNIEDFIQDIVIEAGQTFRLDMSEAQLRVALLYIITTPDNAQVFVNGELLENTSAAQVEFGEVRVRVEHHGFLPQEQVYEIVAPMTHIAFELAEIVNEKTLTILTSPSNAEIHINNLFIGHSTLTHSVPPGTYSIVARLPGFESSTITVTVTGHETEDDIWRHILLTAAVSDPFANIQQPDVEPIPPETPSLPTMSPQVSPSPTPPPPSMPLPTPTPLPEVNDDGFWFIQPPP
jgi:hypothetical protein